MTTNANKIWRWVADAALVILLALMGWAGSMLMNISQTQAQTVATLRNTVNIMSEVQRVQRAQDEEIDTIMEWKAETSANRFTVQDGYDIWKEISVLRENLAQLPTRDDIPPEWFKDKVSAMEADIVDLQRKINGDK